MIDDTTVRRLLDARGPFAIVAAAAVGAALLLLVALGLIDHPPLYDELLHMLAARGVIDTGQPVIDTGVYSRAELFSRVVALSLQTLGDDAVAARIPALASAALLAALVGGWCAYRAGWLAGTVTAGLLAAAPSSLSLSVLARFYTLHALVVACMLIALFEMLAPGRSRTTRIVLGAVALALLPIAYHLQETTVISAGAGALACLALVALDRSGEIRSAVSARPLATLVGAIGVVVIGLLAVWQLGLLERLGAAPLWAADRSGRIAYYNSNLVVDFPLLWPLLPLAAAAALVLDKRLAVYCIVLALAALVVHSIAAQKAVRYFYHVLPFVCVLWGCGFRQSVDWLGVFFGRFVRTGGLATIGAVLLAAFTVVNSQEGQRTAKLVIGRGDPSAVLGYGGEADWSIAVPALREHLDSAERLVVSSSVKGLYNFGRYDYELNSSVVLETESHEEFGRDPRTGRQAIGTGASVARVLDEPGTTVVVIEAEKLDNDSGAPREAVDVVRSRCTVIDVPAESQVFAWRCGDRS